MIALGQWSGAVLDGPFAFGAMLLVKITTLLAFAWALHAVLGGTNPRWRVLLWRSTAGGMLLLLVLAVFPPFLRIAVLPPRVVDHVGNRLDATAPRETQAQAATRVPESDAESSLSVLVAQSPHDAKKLPDLRVNEDRSASMDSPNVLDSSLHVGFPDRGDRTDSRSAPPGFPYTIRAIMNSLWAAWGGGVLIGVIGALVGLRRLLSIRGRTITAPDWIQSEAVRVAGGIGLCTPFEIGRTDDLQSPCVVGFWRPLILLPGPQCDPACREELPSILAHELAHLKGGDVAWNTLLNALSVLFWFHPLMWRIRQTHADACDAVSDAVAARFVGDPALYGRILARLTLRVTAPRISVGLAMARKSSVRSRIEAVRRHIFVAGLPRRRKACAVLMGLVVTFALGGLGAGRSDAEPPKSAVERAPIAKAETTNAEPEVAQPEPGIVTGVVVNAEDGTPIAGANVLLRDTRLHNATTDEEGRFRFQKIPAGKYLIWAFKGELASAKEHLQDRGASDVAEKQSAEGALFAPIRLAMRQGKEVRLTVLSAASGQPLESAGIRLSYPDRRSASTDKAGVAVVQGLLPEKYEITIQAPGHAFLVRDVDLSGSEQIESQSVSLLPGGTVRGTVRDEDGKLLARAEVGFLNVGSSSGYGGESPTTNSQGEYRHLHLPLNTPIRVSVRMQEWVAEEKEILLTDQQKEQQLDFQLKRRPQGGSVTGIVRNNDGKPIAGAKVGSYGYRSADKRETTTDAEGRYVLHDLFKGFSGHDIFVQAPGFSPFLKQVQPGTADAPTEVSVQLEPGHSIRGRLQSADGAPIRGAYVMDNSHNQGKRPQLLMNSAKTDADGRFEFNSLRADTTFRISAKGFSTRAEATLPLDGEQVISVTLEPMGVLRGKVADASTGEAIPQFKVRLGYCRKKEAGDVDADYDYKLSDPGLTVRSKEGTFVINDLTNRGAMELTVEADGYERTVVPRGVAHLAEDLSSIEVPLKKQKWQKLATLAGKVIDHAGKPTAGVQLRLIVSPKPSKGDDDNDFNWALIESGQLGQKPYVEQYLTTISDAEGQFQFKELLPEKYPQIAYWGKNAPKGRSLAMAKTKPGLDQFVTIQLPKPASLRGSFDTAMFPRAGSIQLSRQNDAFHSYEIQLVDGKNEFTLGNLPPGDYWVSVVALPERDKDQPQLSVLRPIASRKLTIEPGEAYEIRFTAGDAVKQR